MVEMVTTSPAKTLNWCNRVGSLRPGLFADLAVIGGGASTPYASLIEATEEEVLLTAVDGDPVFGRSDWLGVLKPGDFEVQTSGCGFQAAIDATDPLAPRGNQPFSQIQSLLAAASVLDFQHMKANFKDPAVSGMTDAEFQAYLDQRFALGIIPRPLDPYWVIDDPDYFTNLQNETNVTALDPLATLDIEPAWESDGDAVLDACDNCPEYPNPGQEAVVFGETILATSATTFSWTTPGDVRYVRGAVAWLGTYTTDLSGDLVATSALTDVSLPSPGVGFYYLLRLGGTCAAGSWQSSLGAEPGRDLALP